MQHYGDILKEMIDSSGKSQREVAKKAGINEGQLRYIINKQRPAKVDTLAKIAFVLDESPRLLLLSWFHVNIGGIAVESINELMPDFITHQELVRIYKIRQAEDLYNKYSNATVQQLHNAKPEDIKDLLDSLGNCLSLINNLNGVKQ